jgi:hypothetical protein
MDPIQSQINIIEGRISQYENSTLFSEAEKISLIEAEKKNLEILQQKKANNIEVNNPEILS